MGRDQRHRGDAAFAGEVKLGQISHQPAPWQSLGERILEVEASDRGRFNPYGVTLIQAHRGRDCIHWRSLSRSR